MQGPSSVPVSLHVGLFLLLSYLSEGRQLRRRPKRRAYYLSLKEMLSIESGEHTFFVCKGSFDYSGLSNQNSESKFFFFSIFTLLSQFCQCDVVMLIAC